MAITSDKALFETACGAFAETDRGWLGQGLSKVKC